MNINKTLLIFTTIFLLTNNSIAETTPGLRSSEKEFLEKIQEKKQSLQSKQNVPTQENLSQYEQCQTALKKIDKLSLEVSQVKTTPGVDEKQWKDKIKSLESQIERYKTQSKQFCSKELLNKSINMKSH